MESKFMLLSLAALAAAIPAAAQRDNRNAENDVVSVVSGDVSQAKDVEKAFKANAPIGVRDNGLPRFAIVGKDNKFYLGIGAQLLGEAVYDFGDEMPSETLFVPADMQRPKPGDNRKLGFGWNTSSIYMNFVALPNTDNSIGIFFKANFLGDNNAFNCFHFYGKYRGLTVGYTTSLFSDGAAEPSTIDFEGPNGYPYTFLFTAYWTQQFTKNFSGAIGIDAPTGETYSNTSTQTLPAVPLYLQYAWGGGASHVRLSGLIRPIRYRNSLKDKNCTPTGLGVQLSGMANVVGPLSVQYNVAYGSGIGSYLQDDNGLDLDALPNMDGGMSLTKTLGVTGGLSYQFSPKVTANAVYSHLLNSPGKDAFHPSSSYRLGDYVAANVMWTINKFLSAGIEYDYGHTKDFGGNSLHTNRVQCQFGITL